jgi:hypothetical protein
MTEQERAEWDELDRLTDNLQRHNEARKAAQTAEAARRAKLYPEPPLAVVLPFRPRPA